MISAQVPTQMTTPRWGPWRKWLAALGWFVTALYFLFAALVLALRYWILPDIGAYAGGIEQAISRSIGQKVTIGGISAGWQGLHPQIDLSDVRIHDRQGRVALSLPVVEAVIGWRSIPLASLRLRSLAIERPDLDIRRDRDGRLFVAGIQLQEDAAGPDLSYWVLSQNEIVIRDARLSWEDERRGAPALVLSGVSVALQSSGLSHRFALRAQTVRELASMLDVRGEIRGDTVADLGSWSGRLFAELDYVDLAAWHRWIDYPLELQSGKGALRLWLAMGRGRLTEVTADLALAQVRARIARDLPLLDLEYLHGRLSAADSGKGIDVYGRKLALKTTGGVALPPAEFALHWEPAIASKPAKGELQANALELEPLARLAEFLPFPAYLRKRLAEIEPHGAVHDLKLAWSGEPERPQRYVLRARFGRLGVKSLGAPGGFAGLSGNIEATETGGALRLDSENVALRLPEVLAEESVQFDTLGAQIGWSIAQGHLDLKLSNVALSNRDIAGSLHGGFSTRATRPESLGTIDLTGNFSRVDARMVYRYVPYLPKAVQEYFRFSMQGGRASDLRFRLKGDLKDFPFDEGKSGIFQVSAQVSEGEFRYAEGWPRLSAISAEINLQGRRLHVSSSRAAMLGARISNVRAQVPDVFADEEQLQLEGLADGPTSEFLRFLEVSPLGERLGAITRGMSATGSGRLQLKFDLPIRHAEQIKVSGGFQFQSNHISFVSELPTLAQLSGRIEFTENTLSGRNLSAQLFDGSTNLSLATSGDGALGVTAQGTANVAAVRKLADMTLLERASGHAAWRGSLILRKENFDLVVESSLTGVAIALPAPFGKVASETLPLKFERSNHVDAEFLKRAKILSLPPNGDAVAVSLGRVANGLFLRRNTKDGYVIERGALGLNDAPPALGKSGVSVSGTITHLNLDRWRSLMGGDKPEETVSVLRLSVGTLDVAGKRLNDVKLQANPGAGAWRATLVARELAGSLNWLPEGRGRIVARLKHFTVPDAAPEPPPQEAPGSELPALDIVAEEFVMREKKLGRLELVAVNETRDWRIEKLILASSDGTLLADGIWQSWATRPSVVLNLKLESNDTGSFLTRFGYPGTVKGGTAKLEGKLGWVGSPQAIDYPTLTGNLTLTAGKGQFLKAEPGIAKLLGILSLQSWITLDFRDLFAEGFAFESLSSTARVAKGMLSTEDFAMSGKSAQVSMSGTIDLAQETQNLKVRVVPSLGDSLSSVAGIILANPVAGIGALVAQRLLKDPLGQIFAFEYTVTGTWSDPKTERTRAEVRPAENPTP